MILITGATGTNGLEIVRGLAREACNVRAMVRSRDSEAAKSLAELAGVEVVVGDFDDMGMVVRHFEGVRRAFLLTPSSARAEEQQLHFVAAAREAGVAHLVKLSQFAASSESPVRFLRYHAVVEAAIRATGMAWTFLRPNLFMQGLLQFAPSIQHADAMTAPIGDAQISVVDIRDNAAVAVAALTQDGHESRTYTLTGPEALTHVQIANRIGIARARDARFAEISPATMRTTLASFGMDSWQADGLIEDYAHYARGEAAVVTDDIRAVTGRPARSFDAFALENAAAFAAQPSA